MSGVCVEKLPHSCGSSDGLQVFLEGNKYTGYCYVCETYVPNPYEDKPDDYEPKVKIKSKEEIARELIEIYNEFPVTDLPERKLRADSLEYFGIKIGLDESDGVTPRVHYYPYYKNGELVAYKVRIIANKRMWSMGSIKESDLFGWIQAKETGARKLFITEGELDAVALFQILKDSNRGTQYEEYNPAVVSLSNGASGAVKEISRHHYEMAKRFKEIIFVPDQDAPGKKAAEDVAKHFADILIADLPCKDANACLMEGRSKAAKAAVMFSASKPKNTRLVYGGSLSTAAKKKPEPGIAWPWEGMTKATRGIRRMETYYFGAGVKMGKSEVVNAIGEHLIVNHNLPVFFVKPEEAVVKTYQRLVGKAAGRIFHDPNMEFDEEAFDRAEPLIGDKAIIQDIYQFVNWDNLKNDILYVVKNEGVKDIIIDPITCFTNQMGTAEANEFLVAMTAELSAMAKDLDFTSYLFCHLKAPESGLPHERGGKVLSYQFAGSRAMMRTCNLMVGIEGNKDPDLPIEERNIRRLCILEDREFGSNDVIYLYWNYKTGVFSEIRREDLPS